MITYNPQHTEFRRKLKKFIAKEISPNYSLWEKEGCVPKELYLKAGAEKLLCTAIGAEYGGLADDFLYSVIVIEELSSAGHPGVQFSLHSDIVAPYLCHYASEDLKRAWLPKMAAGEAVGAIAITEKNAGSDMRNIETRAVRDGDDFVINGSKMFISNGNSSDLVLVACNTALDPTQFSLSLLLVEASREGFSRGKLLDKIGRKAQDTSALMFKNVRVPSGNVIGRPGEGLRYLVSQLAQERLLIAIAGQATAETALSQTVQHVKSREVFGQKLSSMQNTRFKLAELTTHVRAGKAFLELCIAKHLANELDADMAAMAKLFHSEMECKVVDECLQFFGGSGYMTMTPIARAYMDSRVQKIYGGTNEIMKEIIARELLGS